MTIFKFKFAYVILLELSGLYLPLAHIRSNSTQQLLPLGIRQSLMSFSRIREATAYEIDQPRRSDLPGTSIATNDNSAPDNSVIKIANFRG